MTLRAHFLYQGFCLLQLECPTTAAVPSCKATQTLPVHPMVQNSSTWFPTTPFARSCSCNNCGDWIHSEKKNNPNFRYSLLSPFGGGITFPLCPFLTVCPGMQLCVFTTQIHWNILFGATFYSNILGIITWQQQQKSTEASGLCVSTSVLKLRQACTSQMRSACTATSPHTPQEPGASQQPLHRWIIKYIILNNNNLYYFK